MHRGIEWGSGVHCPGRQAEEVEGVEEQLCEVTQVGIQSRERRKGGQNSRFI